MSISEIEMTDYTAVAVCYAATASSSYSRKIPRRIGF